MRSEAEIRELRDKIIADRDHAIARGHWEESSLTQMTLMAEMLTWAIGESSPSIERLVVQRTEAAARMPINSRN